MYSKRLFFFFAVAIFFISTVSPAQSANQVQVWLTTVDRSALFAEQSQPLEFGEAQPSVPVIAVNDSSATSPSKASGLRLPAAARNC